MRAIASGDMSDITPNEAWDVYDFTISEGDHDARLSADTLVEITLSGETSNHTTDSLVEAAKAAAPPLFNDIFDGTIGLWVDTEQEDDVRIISYGPLW